MTNYAKATLLKHKIEFKRLSSGYISVGVDGTLIANEPTASRAIFEATEHVRVIENLSMRPNLPEDAWVAVEQLGVVEAAAHTRRQIAALQDEAGVAGDLAMVAICASALDGDPVALAEVERCLGDAAAMRDD